MPKRKQGEVDNQGVQDFELIELLIRESVASTSAQRGNDFESFQARFQSYIDQIPSYLHSVGKEGFFPHFFLGSFSTLIDTEIAKKLDIEKIYFSFDGPKTLKVAVIKNREIKSPEDVADKVKLFVIAESGSTKKKFSYGELDKILGNTKVARNNIVRLARDKGMLGVKLVEITKKKDAKGKTAGISVEVKSDNLDQDTSTAHDFKEIKKGVWNNPESDIAELTNSDKKEVKKSLNKVLKKIGEVHSGYRGEFKEERLFIRDGSLTYAKEAREAAHHGFIAGALVNFRYKHNLRVYLEQFAGRGYADIVLVPRGKDRSLNAVPIIIEMKAATKAELKEGKIGEKSRTTPTAALKQAEDYTKGFQPNVMRVLTTANDILCVGVNLDHPSPISDIMDKSRNQKITPLFSGMLESIDRLNNGKIDEGELKKQIQNNIERIYHTFPGTGEKGDNHYFSRFLLGQSLLLNEVKGLNSDFEKQVFIYGENIPTEAQSEPQSQRLKDKQSKGQSAGQPSKLDQSHGVTTMVFIPKNDEKSVYVMNIVETDGRTEVLKKGIPLDQLKQKVGDRKIVELDLNFNINEKSNFEKYFSMEVKEPVSLDQYNNKKTDKFKGSFENVPYPNELKEAFDEVLNSQHIDQSASEAPDPEKLKETLNKALDKYKELLGKVGEGVSPFKSLIEKEAHFQAVLHGLFSHYSDIKLGESPESRALILTEFQTGKGKRVDMLVHGVKFADRGSNAKEYIPIGLELKGPREGKEADALKKEANKQITDEYKEGVTYKTLTDGDKVAFVGVVFDKKAGNANSLIQLSNEKEFTPVKVVHSSVMQIGQQPSKKKFNLNSCVRPGGRSKRSVNPCLFSKGDVEKFSKGRVDANNVDKTIINSEKFLTYVKNSQDEAKNAQLVEFIGDKSIEGDRKYLLDKVVGDQGYERYVQNERIKDLHVDIVHQDSSLTKNPKLKSRLMSAAGGIQLIRGIHGAIVSCQDGVTTDCGLNLGGIGWSFASQPIENAMVKIAPKVITSAEKVVGKIPGVLGKQTKFAVQVAGVKFVAGGAAGAITGVFDIVDIGMSANNLVDCKKRENSGNPCGEKEIRDNIASIAFSSVSFISGVALVANPVIGIAVGFALMVGQGVYSGVSNVIEYKKKYGTTADESNRIFWHTFFLQPIPQDVQHLEARKEMVNSLTKGAWKRLNDSPDNVVAYAFGLGRVSGNTLSSSNAKIFMNKKDTTYTKNLSRVIPDNIEGASMICLPQITNQDYEKGITSSVPSAEYYCENAVVISRSNANHANPTIIYDLHNVVDGRVIGSNEWNNNFLIDKGNIEITGSNNVVTGGDNVVNKFVFLDTPSSSGEVVGGRNSTNILDLSEAKKDRNINVAIQDNIVSGNLKVRINGRVLVNSVDPSNYYYVGRKSKVDEVLCMGHSTPFTRHEVIVDSGGVEGSERDIVENCKKVILSPYTTVLGREGSYTFYVRVANLKGKNLHSEINAKGTGTVVFSEFDLLSDCDQITYSTDSNTLSLKINFGQDNQFTLDIKNYVEQSNNKPHFVLIDKNGSNIVPKIEKSDLATIKINSFELHSEYSLDNFENHYKKILNNNKDYKVLSVIRGKTQNQNDNRIPHMVFGSSGDDVINFDQGTMFARGEKGSDVYVITDDINNKEVKIDNHSDDEKADTLFMPEVEKDFLVQQCDLHLNYNNTSIQVKNYLQDRNYRHLIIMNKKGEAFIPDIQSMSCSSSGKGKLVPFLQATQTQNMFLLPKDFQDDHLVIDSHLEDIEKYKDQDDLLLTRESEIPFIIRIEGFYTDRSKWENISYSLWNNNDLLPSSGLLENVDNVMEYRDKLRNDYERIVKEYIEDFGNSTSIIQHNQKLDKNISTSVGQDEERIGVMILKNITPDRVEVSSSGTDLIFRDKKSNHTIKIKDWDHNESYRISKLEFDLGLEPIKILRLNRFSSSEIRKIQNLIDKASENHQNREEYNSRVEDDFRCLISLHSLMKKPTYQCSGFFSLQDQTDFVKSACSREQVEEFENNIPSARQFMMLLEKLHNDLSLNGYNQNILDKCSQVITSGFGVLNLWINKAVDEDKWDEVQTLLDRTANRSNADVEHKRKCSKSWTLLNYFVYNGNVDLGKDIFKLILKKSGSIDALEDVNGWAALHYAVHYVDINMTSFLVDEGAKVDVKNKEGKTPLYLVIEEAKKNKFNMIKFFVESGADIEARDNDGKSPLYLITYSGDLETIKLLFEMIKAKDNSSLKTIKEIDSLRRKIINQQSILSTVKNFVDSYVSDAVQTVAEELRDNVSMHGCAAIVKFGDEIYEFNQELFKEIMTKFISVVYSKTLDLNGILECIDSYHHAEEKIYSYIALLDEMKRNDHLSDNAAFKLAYNVKEIIGSGEKYDLREIKNRLPGCVNDVVFPSKVCIKNVNFGEYLYPTDTKVTDDRRVIATNSIDKTPWKVEFEDGKFYMMNTKGEYLYAADYGKYDDERRSVFTWIEGSQVKQSSWKIEPAKNGNCYIQNIDQREYLYSPVDYFKDIYSEGEMSPGLRRVFTWIGGDRVTHSEWKFEDCSRSRRKRDVEEFESEVSLGSRFYKVTGARENFDDTKILELSARLQNNLLPNPDSDESIVHWYSRPGNQEMLNKMMFSVLASVKEATYPDQLNSRLDLDSCSKSNASSCPPLMRNIYNTINLDKKNIFAGKENVLEITSGYERLDIENFPIQEKVINVNRKRSLLDLSKLVKQVDRNLGIKPIPMIVKEKNDLLIKLSISATGLKKDVMTVRIKDALMNNSYKNLQIVFDNVPMEIDNDLKLTPSILISNNKITVVTPENIEEGNKLIICREVEVYTFLHHKYDLIMTNALSANVSEKELYVMYFKDFYKEPKMKTLSIRFIDKEILLDDKINKIYNSDSIDKLNHANFTVDLQDRGINIKANDFHDDTVLKLAYCIKEVIEKINNKEEISSFERLKNKLPESVKNIVFSPTACIKNIKSNGYLYASSDKFRYNHERRGVSTQVGGRKNQQVFWKVDPSHGNSYIENVEFNECLHPPVNDMHSSEGRNIFTLIRRGGTRCNFWKFEPVGENVRIQDAQSGGYLYVPIHNSKHNNNGSNVGTERTKDEKSLWRLEDCGFTRNKRDIKQLESKVSLDSKTIKAKKRASGSQTSASSGRLQRDFYLSRKPLAIDSSNQPEITASSGTRPSSWINDCISWVKSSVGKLLSSKSEGTASSVSQVDGQFAKASVSNSSLTSTTLPSDGTDKRQENGGFFRDNVDYVNANLKRMCERQAPVKFKPIGGNTILEMGDHYLSQVDFNGTITLFDLLIRRVTGQKYISTGDQSISPLEAKGYALSITKGFEKVVEQAGLKSGVSMHRLDIDYMGMQKEITRKVMSGKFNEISGILKSYVEKACPGREAGCPGKLSSKKFDKFMVEFNSGLNVVLNQSIQQILHNGDGTLEVDGAKQMNLEPQSYLSNAYVQGHSKDKVSTCLSEIGVTKLGVNLNR